MRRCVGDWNSLMVNSTKTVSPISAVKLALMAKQVRAHNRKVLAADPIAIVGMACRVPGADRPERFWRLLCNGLDTVRRFRRTAGMRIPGLIPIFQRRPSRPQKAVIPKPD